MALKYLGSGEFIVAAGGVIVPPRDLTDAEAAEHKAAIAANAAVTGRALYAPAKPSTKPADPAQGG